MAGSYVDPVFGTTEAQAFMQFKSSNIATVIPVTSVFDSVVLRMRFDFYSYGSPELTTQTYNVYEVAEELNLKADYFFNSTVGIGRIPIGTTTFDINHDYFKEEFEDTNADSVLTLKVKLSSGFGQRLFDAIDPEDVNYTDFELFKANFRGLAIRPGQSDKIVGFNPSDLNSSLILYYHDDAGVSKTFSFVFSQGVTFSKILTDRSASDLAGLDQFHTDFDPGIKRYIQSGTSVVTKLDFSKYYEYIETIPNMIVNSAALEISETETSSNFKVPKELSLSMLRLNNRLKNFNNKQDTVDYISFNGKLALDNQFRFFAAPDQGQSQIFSLNYSATDNKYIGYPTLFIQQLYNLKSTQYPFWALRSSNPQPGKSVDRLVFPKDKVKLKIYYTRSTLDKQ